MRWRGRRQSGNIEDRRGGMKTIAGGGGLGLIILLVVYLLGGNPSDIMNTSTSGGEYTASAEEKELAEMVSVVLAETEDTWTEIFSQNGWDYQLPVLVLFTGQVQSACGIAGSAVGPFYCPGDYKLYIDLGFYKELQNRFRAPGDFAMAYVVAHEVGHHVQNLLGTSQKVMELRSRLSETEFNKYMVMLELQADFYAGVWAHYAAKEQNFLEEGDIDEALNAASQIGDDMIQKRTQGHVVPESFTHGTSEQRRTWFYKGYRTGDIRAGDTFNAQNL